MTSRVNILPGLTTALLAVVITVGCQHRAAVNPPDIHYGEDVCAFCQMTINDPRFAAAVIYRTLEGRQRIASFDDIGCMLAWQREHAADHTTAAFVHDYKTRQWIEAARAWYVRSPAIQTPMGWRIAAGETPTDAEAAAPGEQTEAMDYSELSSVEQNKQSTAK